MLYCQVVDLIPHSRDVRAGSIDEFVEYRDINRLKIRGL